MMMISLEVVSEVDLVEVASEVEVDLEVEDSLPSNQAASEEWEVEWVNQ